MPGSRLSSDLQVYRGWRHRELLLAAVRECFAYGDGEDRATGCLYAEADQVAWPRPLAVYGPALLDDLESLLAVRFPIVVFQAYRGGAGCGWHADTPFAAQAILSLGVTRTFGVRRPGRDPWLMPVSGGDLVFMPDGFQREWEHCVPEEDVPGERCSLVFRTAEA
jgi:alkylated DNA repair dioxygenase AlkB